MPSLATRFTETITFSVDNEKLFCEINLTRTNYISRIWLVIHENYDVKIVSGIIFVENLMSQLQQTPPVFARISFRNNFRLDV